MTKNEKRDAFREGVFARDRNTCVVLECNRPAVDAHHIIERELWRDPDHRHGYLLDNGASLCETHHRHSEANFIPPQALRLWAGIERRVLPSQLDPGKFWTKWGDEIPGPNRVHIKYPHTPYLPFSPSSDSADVADAGYMVPENLVGKPCVITTKMDGSNMMMTRGGVAARNGYDAVHSSFDRAKALHAGIAHLIPEYLQIFGEWLYAKHSIHYVADLRLPALYMLFAVYDQRYQLFLGWADVERWAEMLGFPTVPVLGKTAFDARWKLEREVGDLGYRTVKLGHEGIVVRSRYPFHYGQFAQNVAKFVRLNHVQTDTHWMHTAIVRNEVFNNRLEGGS